MLRMKLLAGVAFAALLSACDAPVTQTEAVIEDAGSPVSEEFVGGSAADRWADTDEIAVGDLDPVPVTGAGDIAPNDYAPNDYPPNDYAADNYDAGNYADYPAFGDAGYDDSDYAGNYYPDTAYDDFDYDSRYYDDYDRYGSNVDYDYFYDALSPHGEWFYHPRWGYVWSPARVGNDFRPYYSAGYWQDTYEFGWTWVSDYSWGRIPFHYGRWVFDPGDGWIWLPGYVWAPSWTIWRSGGDYVGWFPMPPSEDFLVGAEVANNDWGNWDRGFGYADWYGAQYDGDWSLSLWVFVERDRFANRDFRRWEAPRERRRNIVQNTTNVTNYVTVNNYIVNRSVEEPGDRPAQDGGWQRRRARDVLGNEAPVTQASLGRDIQQRERGRFGGDEAASPRERLRPVPDDAAPTEGQTPPPEQPDRDPGDRRAARQLQQEQERAAREQQQEQERAAQQQQEQQQQEQQQQEQEAARAAQQAEQEAERAAREAQQSDQESARAAQQAQQEAERAAREAQQAEQESARAAQQAQQEAERAAREAQQAEQESARAAQQAQQEAERAAREAQQADQESARAAQQAQQEAERAAREAQQAEQEAARAAQQQQQEAERERAFVIQQEEAARAAQMETQRLEAERVRAEEEAEQERVRFEQQEQQEQERAAREEEQRLRQAEREAQRQERQQQRGGEGQGEQPPQ